MKDVWNAMNDKTRREILKILKNRDLSAGEIAEKFNLTKATVSHHLSVLKEAGLIDAQKKAQSIYYSLNMTVFQSLLLALNQWFFQTDAPSAEQADKRAQKEGTDELFPSSRSSERDGESSNESPFET